MMLRPMKMEDADFLLELKNYPETRLYSIVSKEEIKRENHLEYLEDNIQYFQVIETDKLLEMHEDEFGIGATGITERIGVIRIKDNEVSIWIDKQYWSKGYATRVLKMASYFGITAKIVWANVASLKAFIRAGFTPIGIKDNYYIFQK